MSVIILPLQLFKIVPLVQMLTYAGPLVTYDGPKAKVESSATTFLTSYDMDNVTVYGGLKNQSLEALSNNPLSAGLYDYING